MALSSKTFTTCSNCDEVSEAEEPLYMCVMQNCSKYGEPLCEDCGISAHKRKNHKFILTQDHIKPINLTVMQQNINNGSVIMQQTFAPQHNIKAESERAKIAISTASLANPMIIAAHASHTYAFYNGNSILSWLNWINQPDTMKATIQELTNNPLLSQQQLAGVGAVLIAAQETIIHTRRFMNGDIATYKEYGYHMAKGLAGTIGYALANATAVSYGVTYGTLIGGPIGGIIGGIVCGLFGGIAGVKTGRWVFDQVWSDDFIRNKQNGREQMIRDSLKLFGILDIKDIENREIFNQRELKKTYRSLAKRYHPDKNGGTPESHAKFHEINAALGVLLSILQRKNKKKLIKKLTEIRAIKWKNDVQRLGQILKEEKLLYIVDICTKWNKNITIEFLSKMRYEDILEMLKDLNEDEKYKYTVKVVERNRFVNAIQKWSGEDNESVNDINSECKDDNDDIEYDEIEELRDELRKKKVLDVAEICKEIDTDLTLETLLEYTKSDLLQLINDINDDESNKHKISVIKKNKFVKIMQQEAKKQCELCVSK
eukprot:295524_1